MPIGSYLAYCLACIAIIIVPGPTVTVIIANSLRYGAKAGLLNVAGTQAGLIIWMGVAVFGLASAISLMGLWFDALKLAGAAYLIWLGIKLLRSTGKLMSVDQVTSPPKGGFFFQGLLVILSNPKVLLVFGALIPQFIAPEQDFVRQLVFLGVTFMVLATFFDSLYALAAGRAGALLANSRVRAVEIVSGLFLIAGGIWLAFKAR
jgi:threonine/homoserine/homoserine lactone efflux protein